ncbi:MAG: alpha-2-macroglobulin domain-containing protein, partial [Candidatus Peregrinibacteria bacterium Greene1014_49]
VRDGAGREAKADTSVYAWSSTYVNWPHSNSNRMTVLADKPEYKLGETAKLLIQSPYQGEGVTALVSIEREGLIRRTVIPVESSAQAIEIPITEDLIPNAYVSVVVVKPRIGETFNEHGLDTGAPAFRIGYVKLKVENKSKGLTVNINPDKRRYVPGEVVSVILATEDHQGKPVPAEVSLSAVDMSVLALTGYELPDLLSTFYSDRGLGVRTAVNLLYLLERFKPGSKGGGGSDGEEKARGTFKDTAYWNPNIITDENGRATVEFTLPDNLTTWKLIAIAHTPQSLVGSVATEILETKHVIVRPVRPRFAVHGDRAELAAIVHNGTEEAQEFTVTLTGKGFDGGREAQKVTIPAEGQQKVIFPVTFGYAKDAEFVFMAEGETGRDEIHETIPLHPFGIPQSVATSGFTEQSVTEQIFVPVRSEVTGIEATATLSPTLASYLPKSLDYLVQFPYGCAEQTVSSFLPNIAVAELQGFDAFKVVTDEELKEKITAGIERLLTFQRNDGGFGYWTGSSESYPYLSAYILHALHLTRLAGYPVDSDLLARTRTYLEGALREKGKGTRSVELSERAYILYVLGETGSPDASLLSNLYGKREELGLFAASYLAMSLEKSGDHRRALSLVQEILAEAKVSPRGVQFEEKNSWWYRIYMNTDSRTTAIVLQALMRIDPENALTPKIVRSMLSMRQNGHWDTTQSTTASIFSLVEYLKYTRELEGDFTAALTVDGTEIGKAIFDASTILSKKQLSIPAASLEPGQFNTVEISKEGTGRLYYDLLLSYFWKTREIASAEEGISVVREITPVSGSPLHPTVGGTYQVKLTITVPESRHFVAIESPHPAGFEGIDFALKTSQQYLEEEVNEEERSPYGWWWDNSWVFTHKEYRDDQVFLFADNLPAGVYHYEYLVRATLPGTFLWRPARAYEMYFPEVFGNTESAVVEIRDNEG